MSEKSTAEDLVEPRQLFVLSGPSGVGKNTVADRLCRRGRAVRAVTATTRRPRPGEVDGRDYWFVSEEQFRDCMASGRLVEHTRYVGHYYGTPLESVNRAADSGLPVILTIDVDGGVQLKERWPQATLIFLEPPSEEELRRRLSGRGQDDEANVARRVARAREEMAYAGRYDFRVVNAELDDAVAQVEQIMACRCPPRGARNGHSR